MIEKGLPSFYITINPADVYNPVVKFLAGSEIDVDDLLPNDVPNYWDQSVLVAKNPVVAACFFNIYMKAFISALLGYDRSHKNLEGGILGVVKAYYGCVEAQGRGTLHCHMLVWVEGGLNLNEIKKRALSSEASDVDFCKRLLAFLDDTISNAIPPEPEDHVDVPSNRYHPCSVRGIPIQVADIPIVDKDDDYAAARDQSSPNALSREREQDLHNLISACQSHDHSKTCFKYWRGPPEPKSCRFDLHEDNFRPESSFDPETGELCLRCLNGLVNNFNTTMIEAIRCNMDIKFIGSGASAKGILYYIITDYISKSQLKTHVAFSMLELAVKKLGQFNPLHDDLTVRAQKMLQNYAYAMISQQELSGQQVASYLMDFEDHFTSHSYRNLYWTAFEGFINRQLPSPECYPVRRPLGTPESTEQPGESLGESRPPDDEQDDSSDARNEEEYEDTPFFNDLFDESGPDENQVSEADQEVGVSIDGAGNLVPIGDQLGDYHKRGPELTGVCVWDFIARVDKVSKTSDRRKHQEKDSDVNESEMTGIMLDDAVEEDEENEDAEEPVLEVESHKRHRVALQRDHDQAGSHILRVRALSEALIPVPIGPGIPRRDKPDMRARYCRLMLIFFKPWRQASDLRGEFQSCKQPLKPLCPPVPRMSYTEWKICRSCTNVGIVGMIILQNAETALERL
jgi:hypothetical protein